MGRSPHAATALGAGKRVIVEKPLALPMGRNAPD